MWGVGREQVVITIPLRSVSRWSWRASGVHLAPEPRQWMLSQTRACFVFCGPAEAEEGQDESPQGRGAAARRRGSHMARGKHTLQLPAQETLLCAQENW